MYVSILIHMIFIYIFVCFFPVSAKSSANPEKPHSVWLQPGPRRVRHKRPLLAGENLALAACARQERSRGQRGHERHSSAGISGKTSLFYSNKTTLLHYTFVFRFAPTPKRPRTQATPFFTKLFSQ